MTVRAAFAWLATVALMVTACAAADESTTPSVVTDASGSGAASRQPSASEEASASAGAVGSGSTISAFDLEVGDCFDAPEIEAMTDVELIDCGEPHRYESYLIENHPAGREEPFIGDVPMSDHADEVCMTTFEAFVGVPWEESSPLTYFYLQPTAETWEEIGDREVLCAVYSTDGDLTGSVEGSAP